MSNGDTDLTSLSLTLLKTLKTEGRPCSLQAMPNLSDCAKQQQPLLILKPTNYSSCRPMKAKKIEPQESQKASKRWLAYSQYSNQMLANLDAQNIKLLGVSFAYDETDRSWAN